MLAVLAGCQPMGADTGPQAGAAASAAAKDTQVEALVGRCVQAMLQDVCGVRSPRTGAAGTPGGVQQPPAVAPVFVAGTGAIDARAYREIQDAGESMCAVVRVRCAGGWDSSACRTARSLWPQTGPLMPTSG